MRSTRPDYRSWRDIGDKIPEDEPVFVLRAQDIAAPDTVAYYAGRVRAHGGHEIAALAYDQAREMSEWQAEHGCKVPDLPTIDARAEEREPSGHMRGRLFKAIGRAVVIEGSLQVFVPDGEELPALEEGRWWGPIRDVVIVKELGGDGDER